MPDASKQEKVKESNITQFFEEGVKILTDSSESFNIFEMLGQSSREMTHSAFIAGLLNPKGNHNVGPTFLSLFLQKFNLTHFDPNSAEVIIEKDCGKEREDDKGNHLGGRIDIYLKDNNGHVIVIENKIYASDQDYQLERYWNSTDRKATLIYLTLDGHQPSAKSIGNIINPADIRCVSYSEIKEWLEECRHSELCSKDVKFAIRQYMNNLGNLISEFELKEYIKSSFENLRLSLAISNHADSIRNEMRKEFMIWLSKFFTEKYNCNIVTPLYEERKELIFALVHDGLKLDICLDHNVYIRIYKPEPLKNYDGIIIGNQWRPYHAKDSQFIAWRYLELKGTTMDFHNFNSNAYIWLDDRASFEEKLQSTVNTLFEELKSLSL